MAHLVDTTVSRTENPQVTKETVVNFEKPYPQCLNKLLLRLIG